MAACYLGALAFRISVSLKHFPYPHSGLDSTDLAHAHIVARAHGIPIAETARIFASAPAVVGIEYS